MPRTILITLEDNGSTQVEILGDDKTSKFFTKREFDIALRAAKLAYRREKKEYHRNQLLKRLEDGEKDGNSKENKKEVSKQPESKPEPARDIKLDTGKVGISGGGKPDLASAIRAKESAKQSAKSGKRS